MQTNQNLQNAITEYNMELEKYNVKQTKISGTKIRGLLMQINKLTKEARKEILEAQKAVPKKPRAKKETVAEAEEDEEHVEKVVAPTPPDNVLSSRIATNRNPLENLPKSLPAVRFAAINTGTPVINRFEM